MAELDDLLDAIFSGTDRALYRDFATWMRSSRRFRAFASTYRTKIRAKLRNARRAEGMEDLRAELETAAILLKEEHFAVDYEAYAATKQRGPDFTVTFKTHTPFNVEVRHLRNGDAEEPSAEIRVAKLAAVLCDKAAQMQPGIVNFLWLASEREVAVADLAGATTSVRQMAERKVDPFFAHFGYESAAEFLKQYQRLSGIVVRRGEGHQVWPNALARHKPAPGIIAAIQRLTG